MMGLVRSQICSQKLIYEHAVSVNYLLVSSGPLRDFASRVHLLSVILDGLVAVSMLGLSVLCNKLSVQGGARGMERYAYLMVE